MALRALIIGKKISERSAKLGELRKKLSEMEKRETELAAEIDNAEINEETENAVNEFTEEKNQTTADVEALEEEIRKLEAELASAEAETKTEKTEERKEERHMELENTKEVQLRAFADYLRGIEHRDDYNMTQGNNGAVVPETIAKDIITKVAERCPIFEKATRYNVKGTLDVPYYPANSSHVVSAAYSTEMDTLTASSGDFNKVSLTGFLAGALAKISKKLINNADVDVVPFITEQMVEAFKNFYEKESLIGTNNKVTGLVSGIESGMKVTAAAKSSVTTDELIECQAKIPTAYQANCCWIMAPATFTLIRKLKLNNEYALNPDIRNEFGYTLLGKPVYLSDNAPALGTASNLAVIYGDLSGLGIKLAEDLEIQVLREKYADQHAVGVIGWTEFDAKVINGQKFAAIACGSSDPQ